MGAPATAALYMVDTCSFTELRRTYPRPTFNIVWGWLENIAAEGRLLSVEEVYRELDAQDDEVAEWARNRREIFLPLSEDIQQKAREILATHPTLVDLKRRKSGADPFLIAAAIIHGAIVVTQEKPIVGSPKVKIPNVCEAYGVRCIPLLTLLQLEGLTT